MVTQFTQESASRLQELLGKVGSGDYSDKEFDELGKLSKAKKKATEDRVQLIADMKQSLASLGVAIHDLFTPSDIASAARALQPDFGKVRRQAKTVDGKRTVKSGLVLISVQPDKGRGAPATWTAEQADPQFVPGKLRSFAAAKGDLASRLAATAPSEDAKKFLETDVGKAKLAHIVEFIRSKKTKEEHSAQDTAPARKRATKK